QFLSGIDYGRFRDFLVKPHPDNLNHDLERLMKDALLQAFHHIEVAYLDKFEKENDFSCWQKIKDRPFKEIKEAFKLLRKNLLREEDYQKEFAENIPDDQKIDFDLPNWLTTKSWNDLPKLTDVLFRFSEIQNEEKWQELKKYFDENLPCIFDLSFKEALKDERNIKAYKAFQMLVMQTLLDQNIKTHLSLDEIKLSIMALENGLQTQGMKDINLIIEQNITKLKSEINNSFDIIILELKSTENRITHKIEEKGNEILDKLNLFRPSIGHHLTEPPFRPEVFLGREDDLEDIRKRLFEDNNLLLLVNGNGGVGKTSLASRYYHQYEDLYSHMAWVLSETSIGDALLALAPNLYIHFDANQDQKERMEILITRLANLDKPCLLVIDNANDYGDLKSYYQVLNRCSNFHILLTTRISEFGQARMKKIESLPIDKAKELFSIYYKSVLKVDKSFFEGLYKSVSGNTLVLELLAKQLKEANRIYEKYNLKDLVSDLQNKGIFQLKHSKEVDVHYHEFDKASPEDVINALYDLTELNEGERKFSSMMAVLPPEGIKTATISILLPDDDWWEEALENLARKGWLDYNEEEKEIKISPVVQEIIKKKNKNIPKDTESLLLGLSKELAYEPWSQKNHGENPNFNETKLYAFYSESLLSDLLILNYDSLLLAKRLIEHYSLYLENSKAQAWFNKIKAITLNQETDQDKFIFSDSLKIIGSVYQSEGRLKEALVSYQKALEILKSLNENYPDKINYKNSLGRVYSQLGNLYQSEGKWVEALDCYQKYLEISNSLHESYPDHAMFNNNLSVAHLNLGDVYQSEGKWEQALDYFQKFLEISKTLNASYPDQVIYKNDLGVAHQRLGVVYKSEGKWEQALDYLQKYLEISKTLNASYPDQVLYKSNLGIAYSNLGDVYQSEGKWEQALDYFQKDIEISKTLNASYPDQVRYKSNLGIAYQRLGDVYQSEGKWEQALDYFQKYLEISKTLHYSYPYNIEYQFGHGLSLLYVGIVKEALNQDCKLYYQEAYDVYEDLIKKVPNHANASNNYEWVKRKLEKK
ncbi:MAG TPA: tetratricopeptide repeat protein, partial [Saprospiraceae bacterium]|nr:tetratricopeptide repeat protein [Saprospiraceae bacterium]